MESIRQAFFGNSESTTEPISGERGAGTTTEPYDKGNEETGTTNETTSTRENANTTAETAKPADDRAPQKQQGADRPGDEPGPKDTEAIKEKKEVGEEAQKTGGDTKKNPHVPHTDEEREEFMQKGGEFPRDPNDHSGEPLHVHKAAGESEEKGEGEGKKDRSASVSQEGGNPHGKTLGTGEKYVKSSGLEADGGDFDATNPGAGAEANRLLEAKGVHKQAPNENPTPEPASSTSDKVDKVSKMDKLKEKLHLNKGH